MKVFFIILCCLQQLAAQNLVFENYSITEEKPYVEVNFEGEHPKKGYKTKLVLLNIDDKDLIIKQVEGSCSCIKTKVKKKKLKKGQKAELRIWWTPPNATEFSGAIRLDSNDPQYPELWIHLMGAP